MLINCHCHVFNFQSIITEQTRRIFVNRLNEEGMTVAFAEFLVNVMLRLLLSGGGFDPTAKSRDVLGELFRESNDFSPFRGFEEGFTMKLKKASDLAADLGSDVGYEGVWRVLDPLAFKKKQRRTTLASAPNFFRFLKIGLLKNIDMVTDYVIQSATRDDLGIAPMMMDITDGRDDDETLFENQSEDTRRQILRYPGRVFPFFAVNPQREEDVYELMVEALETGFVGVKLYPPLGYKPNDDRLDRIFSYCNDNDVPIMTHCNAGGFYADSDYRIYAAPRYWWEILGTYGKLKVCFGHFGGDENLTKKEIPSDSWSAAIMSLMDTFQGRVFADVSYHTDCMRKRSVGPYFDNLTEMLSGQPGGNGLGGSIAGNLLWGSDAIMVLQRLSEAEYWQFFQMRLSPEQFQAMAETNAMRYLGLPGQGLEMGKNIRRHVEWCAANDGSLRRRRAAPWLLPYLPVRT